jgi:ADP-heptose:LPS heptosyltransferase
MVKRILNSLLLFTKPLWEYFFSLGNSFPVSGKRIIILRLDRMGDYLLWRNFLREIKTSEKYRHHSLTLCGNSAWMELARDLDHQWVDAFIEIDLYRFEHPQWVAYRFKKLLEINRKRYKILLHPTFSRTRVSDRLGKLINAKEKTGQQGDDINQSSAEKKITDAFYSRLIPPEKQPAFEFDRNQFFFREALGLTSGLTAPYIERTNTGMTQNFIVIFPGAGHPSRQWGGEKYAQICRRINEVFGFQCVVAGSPSEKKLAEYVIQNSGSFVQDQTACSMTELVQLVSSASMVISNDSAGYHLAVALNIPTVCISNGNHYGRFLPYPSYSGKKIAYCFPPEMNREGTDELTLIRLCERSSPFDIGSITVEQVWNQVSMLMKDITGS